MAILPGFKEHFRDFLAPETVQPLLPRPRSGSPSASESASISSMSNFYSNRSLGGSSQPDGSLILRSHSLYHWLRYEGADENGQTYQKYEKPSKHFKRETRVSPSGPLNHFRPSESSESSATTSQDVRNDTVQTESAESVYTYARKNGNKSNVISFPASSDSDSTWFDLHSPIGQRTWNSVSCLNRDELLAEFWKVKPDRRHYGSQPGKIGKHQAFEAGKSALSTQGQRHKIRELFRRRRHRVYQRDLHLMTCERARLLAESDDLYSVYRTSGGNNVYAFHESKAVSAAKPPSKDDQLMANIYMQALSAIVVQSEHEGRIKAERLAVELEEKLKRMGRYETLEEVRSHH